MDEYIIIEVLQTDNFWYPIEDEYSDCHEVRQWQELKDAQRWIKHHGLWNRKYKFVKVTVTKEDL